MHAVLEDGAARGVAVAGEHRERASRQIEGAHHVARVADEEHRRIRREARRGLDRAPDAGPGAINDDKRGPRAVIVAPHNVGVLVCDEDVEGVERVHGERGRFADEASDAPHEVVAAVDCAQRARVSVREVERRAVGGQRGGAQVIHLRAEAVPAVARVSIRACAEIGAARTQHERRRGPGVEGQEEEEPRAAHHRMLPRRHGRRRGAEARVEQQAQRRRVLATALESC